MPKGSRSGVWPSISETKPSLSLESTTTAESSRVTSISAPLEARVSEKRQRADLQAGALRRGNRERQVAGLLGARRVPDARLEGAPAAVRPAGTCGAEERGDTGVAACLRREGPPVADRVLDVDAPAEREEHRRAPFVLGHHRGADHELPGRRRVGGRPTVSHANDIEVIRSETTSARAGACGESTSRPGPSQPVRTSGISSTPLMPSKTPRTAAARRTPASV